MNNTFAPLQLKAQRFDSKHRHMDVYRPLKAFNENIAVRQKLPGNGELVSRFNLLLIIALILTIVVRVSECQSPINLGIKYLFYNDILDQLEVKIDYCNIHSKYIFSISNVLYL